VGFHTVIEICGHAPGPSIKKLLEFTDLVLYDIKCIDPGKHKDATGKSNELILENAKRLAQCIEMRVRVPLIPDFNDSHEDVKKTVHFVKNEMGPVEIDLLSYDKLGEDKYEQLDRPFRELQAKAEGHMEKLKGFLRIYPVVN